mgnify:FL=1
MASPGRKLKKSKVFSWWRLPVFPTPNLSRTSPGSGFEYGVSKPKNREQFSKLNSELLPNPVANSQTAIAVHREVRG